MMGLLPWRRSTIIETLTTQATLIMDANVLAAMARWPDVPDVYGWLSLTASGQWRLHPRGDAWQPGKQEPDESQATDGDSMAGNDPAGESITSPQILQFIDRNYTCDKHGQWYFQNGPQKVYVRLDAAPYILQTVGDSAGHTLYLHTHNGLDIKTITAWTLDESGKLYAQTEHGPGLIAGRDLAIVLGHIQTLEDADIIDVLESQPEPDEAIVVKASKLGSNQNATDSTVLFKTCAAKTIPQALGFVRYPQPTQIANTKPEK